MLEFLNVICLISIVAGILAVFVKMVADAFTYKWRWLKHVVQPSWIVAAVAFPVHMWSRTCISMGPLIPSILWAIFIALIVLFVTLAPTPTPTRSRAW